MSEKECIGIYEQWPNQCCCKCKFHHSLFSHPWVDGKPMNNQVGWICLMPEFEGKAILSKEHGMCELFTRARRQANDRVSSQNRALGIVL